MDSFGRNSSFPIGMRVLAVDDDPVCLKVLETMLRCCQYHVTVTSRAKTALDMLRKNRDGFDLVISDVHMPEMDGFKLLEIVGLEMDLPVIMLSVNGDKESVMTGIKNGACNYLLKPARMEELKNIWQHVVRKRFDSKGREIDTETGNNCVTNGNQEEQSWRHTRKRKAQNDERGYDSSEGGCDDKDSNAQKKPRVVWTQMLHDKFVGAVNLLGIDKAVPKKILDLMDVENLTRENVASHLQKYRQLLKKNSNATNQAEVMFACMGGVQSFDDTQNNHSIFLKLMQSPGLPFLQQHRGYNRLNTAAGLSDSTDYQMGQMQRFTGLAPPSHERQVPPQYALSRIQQAVPVPFERNQCYRSKAIPQTINTTLLRSSSNLRVPSRNLDYSLMFATDNNLQLLQHEQFIANDTNGPSKPADNNIDHGAYNRSWGFDPYRRNAPVTNIADQLITGSELKTSYDDYSNNNQLLKDVVENTNDSDRVREEQGQEDQIQTADDLPTTSSNIFQKDELQRSNEKPEEIVNMANTQLDLTALYSHNSTDAFGFEPTNFDVEMDTNSNNSFDCLLHTLLKQDEQTAMDNDFNLPELPIQ